MKTILIIGGSGGIGQEIIRLLLEDKYRIINVDMNGSRLQSDLLIDITVQLNEQNVRSVIHTIQSKEEIHVFISAIGYYGTKSLSTFDYVDYYKTMMINVTIPVLSAIEISKSFVRQKSGKMVFLSSAAAYTGSRDIAYSSAKSALNGIIHGLAKSFENEAVYVYGVAPGIVETKMSDNMTTQRQQDTILRTLNKRKCTAENVGKVVRFLVKEDDGYMNGSIVHINNGLYFN